MTTRDKVQAFFLKKQEQLCILATSSSSDQPHAATVRYAVKDDLSIILCTKVTSLKWHNIAHNPRVACVFGASFEEPNIQMEGTAMLFTNGSEREILETYFYNFHRDIAQFKSDTLGFILITPSWVRFTDYAQKPVCVEEETL